MTKLYLIRHAEAEGNLYRIAQGQYDSILTDRGWRQVEALERRFAGIPVDAVYASDLYRTCATAGAICGPKGLPLHRRRDLREICVGVWEQKTWGEIARTDPVQMENFSLHLDRWQVEGGEAPEAVRRRVLAAIREIAGAHPGETMAVVSHGCAIRILLAALEGRSIGELSQTPVGDNTAVSLIEAEGDALRVVFRDDNRHLLDPACTAGVRPRRRANGLEPGLWFAPLRLPEQADFLTGCVASCWQDAGQTRPFDLAALLAEAAERTTLVGYLDQTPVGVVQFGEAAEGGRGWISLMCVLEAYRGRGYGVQLIGQAVTHYRPLGRERLGIALPGDAFRSFFETYGFRPAQEDGGVWEKEIGFRREVLER